MTSSKCKLSEDFGVFSKLHPQRISLIRTGAQELVSAYRSGDPLLWKKTIQESNNVFTKHERGLMSAFSIVLVEGVDE